MQNQTLITRSKARKLGITRPLLERLIKSGEIEAIYCGTRTIKVREADVLRALKTPPSASAE